MAGLRGQITPCDAQNIGEIRKELKEQFQKFEEDKIRQKEIQAEIGRKRNIQNMMAGNSSFESFNYQDSSSIPSTDASKNPFRYVPPSRESISDKGKGAMRNKGTIKSFFVPSSPSDSATAYGPSPPTVHPTLDAHWKKKLRDVACDYIARWWYDADIPFNAIHHIMNLFLMPYMLLERASKALLCMS